MVRSSTPGGPWAIRSVTSVAQEPTSSTVSWQLGAHSRSSGRWSSTSTTASSRAASALAGEMGTVRALAQPRRAPAMHHCQQRPLCSSPPALKMPRKGKGFTHPGLKSDRFTTGRKKRRGAATSHPSAHLGRTW